MEFEAFNIDTTRTLDPNGGNRPGGNGPESPAEIMEGNGDGWNPQEVFEADQSPGTQGDRDK